MSLNHLSSLTIQLLLTEPFYGHLLSALPKGKGEGDWPLLALSGQQVLMRVPKQETISSQTETMALGMLKHELLHLIFAHIPVPGSIRHAGLYHAAADLVVNQYLRSEEQPAGSLALSLFEELEWEAGRGWRYYYERLRMAAEGRGMQPGLDKLLRECREGRHPALQRHHFWEGAATGALAKKVVTSQVRELLREGRQAGRAAVAHLPEAIREALEPAPLQSAGIDWRRALRLFANSSRRTRLSNTIRRPSKRYGTSPGIQVVRNSRLLIAVDTSASVEQQTLDHFFKEIHRLWRQDFEVMIVECDVRIQRKYPYAGHPPSMVFGRGGTRFDAPIAWANDYYRPDALIYFTDGEGPAPELRCRSPLLWAVAGKEEGRHLPGRKVRVVLDA